MTTRYGTGVGIIVFFIAVLILLTPSFLTTPFSISDTDPSTYVIVPFLMLPLLVLFSAKAGPKPRIGVKDIAVGSVMFAAFILVSLLARFYLSFLFASFRVEMLLLPLAFAALAALLFGISNIAKFRGLMLYSALASPAVLFVVINSYNAFTTFNTLIVYYFVKIFVPSAAYLAPLAISANGYSIGIGQACVSIGIFIALALFLIPVAYLYDGRNARKALWVASGVALLFAFNIIRMIGVSYAWLKYGPSSAVALVHASAGVMLFYATIAVMVLIAGKYSMSIRKASKQKSRKGRKEAAVSLWPWSVLIAIAFSVLYLIVTLGNSASTPTSPILLANAVPFNFSNKDIASSVMGLAGMRNFTSLAVSAPGGGWVLFSLSNRTISIASPIAMQLSAPNPAVMRNIETNGTVNGKLEMVSRSGVSETVLDVISNRTEFIVYGTEIPIALYNASSTLAGVYVVMPQSVMHNSTCKESYSSVYYVLLNGLNGGSRNATVRRNMLTALCISEGILGVR